MTWVDVPAAPVNGSRRYRGGDVRVSLASYGSRHDVWNLCVTFCLAAVREAAWLREGVAVNVMRGQGDHAGQLRVVRSPAGRHMLRRRAGTSDPADTPAVALLLPPFAGIELVRRASTPVEWDWSDEWVDVTLPPWACGTDLKPLSAPPQEAPPRPAAAPRPSTTLLIDRAFGGRPTAPGWRDGDTPAGVVPPATPSPSWSDR